jgi:hypothetical protein
MMIFEIGGNKGNLLLPKPVESLRAYLACINRAFYYCSVHTYSQAGLALDFLVQIPLSLS